MFFYKNYVAQVDESDCGIAALSMVFKHYGSNYLLASLRELANTDKSGTSAFALIKTAEKVGFDTKAIKADMSLFDIKDIPYPFIVHVIKKSGLEHYYVVLGSTKTKVIVADPDPREKIKKISKDDFKNEWTGVSIFLVPSIDYAPVSKKKRSFISLFGKLLTQKKLILDIVLSALLITIISIATSYYIQSIIDTFIPNDMQYTLNIISIGLIITYIFNAVFTYTRDYLLIVLGQRLSIDIILAYIRHVLQLPITFFSTRKIGEIVSRFTDANKIIDALASSVISIFLDVLIVTILGFVMMVQNYKLFLITLIFVPFYIFIILAFTRTFEKNNNDQMEYNAILNSSIIEDIRGIETIKTLNVENHVYKKIDHEFVKYLKSNLGYERMLLIQQALKLFIQMLLNLLILWIGARLVIKNKLSIGQLMTFNSLLTFFINPLQNIIGLQPKLQSAKVANNRLNEVYGVEKEFTEKTYINDVKKIVGEIQIKNLYFHYGFKNDILKNINLTLKSKEKLVIVGTSGSGKSTLAKLLVGFIKPSKGEILYENHKLQLIDKQTLRKYINYIPQEPFIFSGSIEENLRLGNKENVTIEDLENACKIAMIYDDIDNMPQGFNTMLDENGSILSGGQKQRLTIARALLSPADVLIFDESTSGLDSITESKLINNLLLSKSKTMIFIAHRLNIAKKVNNILVMKDGSICEKGTYTELIAKHGEYYKLEQG
ncbi:MULTISPECIES: peptide cleavage/export ABC transporter [Limosilactobacillus]|nr:peptide cleavage/export ABC transporter [Limosilactobacillus reuteri]